MPFFFCNTQRHSYPGRTAVRVALIAGAIACCFSSALLAQTASPPQPTASAPLVPAIPSTPVWSSLKPLQQQSLQPLAGIWETLSTLHKRKWMALAESFQNMAPAEQAKFHERMAEWAALKPREREMARLNFADTKKITPQDRAASWEAYQALPAEDRKKLAKAKTKPQGAALAVKPVGPEKLAAIPSIKNQPDSARIAIQLPSDKKTLLPQSVARTARAASAPSPATSSPTN